MVITDEELASKIEYLKKNNFMPSLDNESCEVQNVIRSFYYNNHVHNRHDSHRLKDDPFWFKMTFCYYQVSDEFVHEVNKEYKRFQILNIGKDEF